MTILLILCVLAAAGRLLLSMADRSASDDPGNSIQAYSRAMAALDPSGGQPRRRRVDTAPRSRAVAHSGRPARAGTRSSRRRAPAPAQRRVVRR